MPRHKQSAEQIAVMQNRILDATVSLLGELQPEEISIRKIAEKAELSHMAIYTYFHDRDELVQALGVRQEERIRSRFEKILKNSGNEDFMVNLKEALRDYVEVVKTRPKLFRLLWILPIKKVHDPSGKGHVFEDRVNLLSDLIKRGQKKGFFVNRDVQVSALTLLSIINAPLFLFHMGRISDPKIRDQIINETLDIAIDYITGKPN
jgi:AcrR family transcriptional regulator